MIDKNSSSLVARDYRFFEAAKRAAEDSTFKVKVGAVAVWKNKVICAAASQEKTEPLQKKYNVFREFATTGRCLPKVHAEVALIKKLLKMNIPMRDVKVYVYRICKSREHGIARPCNACLVGLRNAGILYCYYTTDYGYAKEYIGYKEGVS